MAAGVPEVRLRCQVTAHVHLLTRPSILSTVCILVSRFPQLLLGSLFGAGG